MCKIFRYQQMGVLQDQEWKILGESWNSISIFYSMFSPALTVVCTYCFHFHLFNFFSLCAVSLYHEIIKRKNGKQK